MMRPEPTFGDRREAGVALAAALGSYRGEDVVVLGIPRGGVVVAFEVAHALAAPLDVLVVRKLGVPNREELAMGAIASGGWVVLDKGLVVRAGLDRASLESRVRQLAAEIVRRERTYRDGRHPLDVQGKTVIVVDDGLATGATMRAAIKALAPRHPAKLVVATPIGSATTCAALRPAVDRIVCLATPAPFHAVGLWYREFSPTTDEDVRRLLRDAAASQSATAP
jgi:predicted phosphoribosyltransferase